CSAGFTDADGGECTPCDAGTFKSVTGSGICTWCPSHTSSAAGSVEVTDCVCVAGHTAESDGVPCRACDAGTYKAGTGAGECSVCPVGSSSASGIEALTDCKCLAGYGGEPDGVACSICMEGMFKSEVGPGECQFCPANSESCSGSA
ncbi:hypothetical protein T484DRAFT_1575161, partial [Baffinella frigidus]